MEKFTRIDAVAVPLGQPNIDTDQIVPARFLKKPRTAGFGGYLFHDLRFAGDGSPRPDFVLNRPPYNEARILVADRNFGCGSSREHAVWALHDYGFRAVIAPSFGDIFFNNSFKNGFLPIVLPAEQVEMLRRQVEESQGGRIGIDLAKQQVIAPDGTAIPFEIDAFRKRCLLDGVDDIAFTLGESDAIASFEKRHDAELSWL